MVNTIARYNSLNMLSISVSAVLFVTAMTSSSVHAFVPLSTTHNNNKIRGGRCTVANHILVKQPSPLLPSTNIYPCISTTTSLAAHAPLQPGKGGIIVEAKSDFIARDVLIDSMMGRGDGLPPMDGESSIQQKDEFEDFSSNEDSWLSSSNSMSAAQPANRRTSSMGQQSVGNSRQNNRQTSNSPSMREQMVQQLNSGQQFTQQQQQPPPPPQAPPPPSNQPQTPLLDPTQLKISQIQSELTSYSISYDDCFDRTSLEKKLREVRLVMGVAGTMDGDSRRNQQQSVEGEGRQEERGFNLDNLQQSTPIQQSSPRIQPPPPIQPPPQQQNNNFGNSGPGGSSSSFSPPQGAFNTGGVSIKGDASILSSSGFVGGDGNVFSTGPPGGQQPPPQQPSPQSQQPTSAGPSIEELINQQNKARAAKSSRTSPAEQAIFTSSVTNTFSNKKRSPPPPRRQQPPSSNNNSNVRTSISSGYRDNTRPLQPMPKAAGSGSSGSVGNVSGGGSTSTFTSGGQQSAPSPPRPPPQQTKSTTSARNTNSVQQTPTRPTPGNASTGNPFSSNNRRSSTQQGGVGNSFRDSAHGIGFGDVNSYTSTPSSATRGRPTPGNASSGNPSRRSSSNARDNTAGQPSGDGVRLGKSRTSYGDFNSGSSIGGDFGSVGGSSAPQQSNIGGSSASFRNGNANPPSPRSNTAPPQQQVGGPSGRKNSSVSGGGGTSAFSSSSSPSTPISNFGSSDFGPASSMNAGGVSIKGDSSILSSFGQVGGQQGGSTNVFSSGQEAAPPQAPPPPQNVNVSPPQQQPYDPTPPLEEPQLDWLTQDSSGGGNSYVPPSPDPPSVTSDYGSASHSDDMYSQQPTTASSSSSYNGKRISELYQEQGLDMFSGNQDGFGVVQGVENAGGDVSYRGSPDDVKVQGKVGDMGATMGGDFGGSSGGSARYSQGRGYTDMGSDDDL